ncbi:hypothetical protein ACFXI0_06815 [Kitasatospora indigofera]|uniref:hypothetical protein n=1 Tax=Kitasatospora indigofera TaxID=67307 RepID=UPI00367FC542
MLVLPGVRPDGTMELIAPAEGLRESTWHPSSGRGAMLENGTPAEQQEKAV